MSAVGSYSPATQQTLAFSLSAREDPEKRRMSRLRRGLSPVAVGLACNFRVLHARAPHLAAEPPLSRSWELRQVHALQYLRAEEATTLGGDCIFCSEGASMPQDQGQESSEIRWELDTPCSEQELDAALRALIRPQEPGCLARFEEICCEAVQHIRKLGVAVQEHRCQGSISRGTNLLRTTMHHATTQGRRTGSDGDCLLIFDTCNDSGPELQKLVLQGITQWIDSLDKTFFSSELAVGGSALASIEALRTLYGEVEQRADAEDEAMEALRGLFEEAGQRACAEAKASLGKYGVNVQIGAPGMGGALSGLGDADVSYDMDFIPCVASGTGIKVFNNESGMWVQNDPCALAQVFASRTKQVPSLRLVVLALKYWNEHQRIRIGGEFQKPLTGIVIEMSLCLQHGPVDSAWVQAGDELLQDLISKGAQHVALVLDQQIRAPCTEKVLNEYLLSEPEVLCRIQCALQSFARAIRTCQTRLLLRHIFIGSYLEQIHWTPAFED